MHLEYCVELYGLNKCKRCISKTINSKSREKLFIERIHDQHTRTHIQTHIGTDGSVVYVAFFEICLRVWKLHVIFMIPNTSARGRTMDITMWTRWSAVMTNGLLRFDLFHSRYRLPCVRLVRFLSHTLSLSHAHSHSHLNTVSQTHLNTVTENDARR